MSNGTTDDPGREAERVEPGDGYSYNAEAWRRLFSLSDGDMTVVEMRAALDRRPTPSGVTADPVERTALMERAAQAAFYAFGHDVAQPMPWDQAPEDFRITFRMVADAVLTQVENAHSAAAPADPDGRDYWRSQAMAAANTIEDYQRALTKALAGAETAETALATLQERVAMYLAARGRYCGVCLGCSPASDGHDKNPPCETQARADLADTVKCPDCNWDNGEHSVACALFPAGYYDAVPEGHYVIEDRDRGEAIVQAPEDSHVDRPEGETP